MTRNRMATRKGGENDEEHGDDSKDIFCLALHSSSLNFINAGPVLSSSWQKIPKYALQSTSIAMQLSLPAATVIDNFERSPRRLKANLKCEQRTVWN